MPRTTLNINVNTVIPGVVGYDLTKAIDLNFIDNNKAPIDNFIANVTEINKLFISEPTPILGNLIILGYVSAIESYFRAIFRKLILIDEISRNACEKKTITYGAVLSNDELVLPEALFEDISFAGKKNIIESIKSFLNLQLQESNLPPDLIVCLNQFNEICELRHCIIHRFGKFGSKNALTLGLAKHKDHIEKPIKCSFDTLQQIITICQNTVRITNNFLFEKILTRLILDGNNKITRTTWNWNYNEDKKRFNQYYETFYSELIKPMPAVDAKNAYVTYKNYYFSLKP